MTPVEKQLAILTREIESLKRFRAEVMAALKMGGDAMKEYEWNEVIEAIARGDKQPLIEFNKKYPEASNAR